MKLNEIASTLALTRLTPATLNEPDITGGYVSDLLSDVLANAPRQGVLVTIQVHLNVIAVALHAELAAVIFASGRRPDESVIAKGREEGIALYVSPATAFDLVGRLYEGGLRGPRT